MRIKALIASIDVKSGVKNGKPWKMASMLLIEKGASKEIPRLKTPLTLRIADEDMDIADRASEYEDIWSTKAGWGYPAAKSPTRSKFHHMSSTST